MSFKAFAAAALLAGTASASLAAPAAHAQIFNPDAGGVQGLCDTNSSYNHVNNRFNPLLLLGGSNQSGSYSRNCQNAIDYATQEGERNRNHATQSQLIGLGGNLITGLILNSQQKQAEPQRTSPSEAELAILRQQQEIEILKLQLQLQQQNGSAAAGTRVIYAQPAQTIDPGYSQYQQQAPRPYAF